MLTNLNSPKVRYFTALKKKKSRDMAGKFMIEGVNMIEEALAAGVLDKVLYSKGVKDDARGKDLVSKLNMGGIAVEEVSDEIISKVSDVETPQGIIASAFIKECDLKDIFDRDNALILVACGIQDPGNLGTMARTAAASGCTGLIMTSGTVDMYNDKVIRASAGAIFRLNMVKYDDIIDLISSLKRRSVKVFATDSDAGTVVYDADLTGPLAVLVGNEGQGLPKEIIRISDSSISIPMEEGVESLNAAVTSSVILYEAVRQRRQLNSKGK